MGRKSWAIIVFIAAAFSGIGAANAQSGGGDQNASRPASLAEQLNANTVSVISGNPNGTYLYFAYDMSSVLDDPASLRVLPVVGKGAAQNAKDLLYLRGIDMGITQSDILRHFKQTGEMGADIATRLRYITRLYNEEMHVLGQADIVGIEDLRGKKVNFGDAGSGTQISSGLIFNALGVTVEEVNLDQAEAFEALKRGEIAATVLFGGKPSAAFAQLNPGAKTFKFIEIPYTSQLLDEYLPVQLTHGDYPDLIPPGESIDTVAVGSVLAVFNWAPDSGHYRRVAAFTRALFENFEKFMQKPRHPKWREVNLAAELPGWERFGAAREMLEKRRSAVAENRPGGDSTSISTDIAPTSSLLDLDARQRDELFRDFMDWQAKQQTR
jgi:TRAP transporter TAXI family solute receptor